MAHNDLLQRVALEALESGENTVAQLRDDLDIAIERYQQQRDERDVIPYDTWADFADLLAARGRVNPDLVPSDRRDQIIASYPHGSFVNDGSHDLLWAITGGPWFDELEENLIAEGCASDAERRAGDTPLHGWDSIEDFAAANAWTLEDVLAEGVSQDDTNGTIYVPGGFPEPIKLTAPRDVVQFDAGSALYMVLADGETYTPLDGCRIVRASAALNDEDLEQAIKDRSDQAATVIEFSGRRPVTRGEVADERGVATRCCFVDVDELISHDLEGVLDMISERAFGSILASDLSYRVVACDSGSGQLQLAVTADVSAILDEHDVDSLDKVPGLANTGEGA